MGAFLRFWDKRPIYLVDDDLEELSLGNDFVLGICAVDYKDYGIGPGIVGGPDTPDPLLSPKIPGTELHILMMHFLNIASDSRRSLDRLAQCPDYAYAYMR